MRLRDHNAVVWAVQGEPKDATLDSSAVAEDNSEVMPLSELLAYNYDFVFLLHRDVVNGICGRCRLSTGLGEQGVCAEFHL